MKRITSRDNPFYKAVKKLTASAQHRKKSGQALLDGAHLVEACLAADLTPQHVLFSHSASSDPEVAALLEKMPGVPQSVLDDALFAGLTELRTPSGILALIDRLEPCVSAEESRFCLLLEDIQDPGNLGSMLRSAAAAGCDAAFLSKGCADAWSPRVLRAGMGAHFVIGIRESADLPAAVAAFPGFVFAATLSAQTSLYDCDLSGKVAFAIGNEGAGLSRDMLQAVAEHIHIPMPGRVESLNAAAAAAICLFEASRQAAKP